MVHFFTLFAFYFTYIALMICTLQMFYARTKQEDVKAIAQILNRIDSAMDVDSAQSNFSLKSLKPYFAFFIFLLLNLLSFSVCDHAWVPCSELTIISLFFTTTCFVALSNEYDHLLVISIICQFLAASPALFNLPYFPFLSELLSVFLGSAFSLEILPSVHIHIGLPSVVYLIVPFLFLRMAMEHSWHGTYRVLIPHLVCFFWWQITVVFYKHSTWVGLLRGSIGWTLAIVFFPILIVILLIWFLYAVISYLSVSAVVKIVTTLLLLSIPAILTVAALKISGSRFQISSKVKNIFWVLLSFFAVVPMIYIGPSAVVDSKTRFITWNEYSEFCGQGAWQESNMATAQLKCHQLKLLQVQWTGTVKKLTVDIDNQVEDFVDMLPMGLANWIRCAYGVPLPKCKTIEDTKERTLCEASYAQTKKCHLGNMNQYKYELVVTMKEGYNEQDVYLEASHHFEADLLPLKTGMHVKFRAYLDDNIGAMFTKLHLLGIKCLDCSKESVSSDDDIEDEDESPIYGVRKAVVFALNFFLSPIFTFG